ncbi:MAG: hypothetical protein K0R20_91 [Actinomycetia bacterium]|jgi:uncharacterized protein (DUF1697 family)|nr:hypothetical protein [Actinomycetes bacterium]
MARYVALLRGINVGGKNPIPMPALKACFEDAGFEGVGTYIQSGNVVFTGPSSSQAALTERVERAIQKTFAHYEASVVVKSRSQMRTVVDKAPDGFGREPEKYRYDVCFLKPSVAARQVVASLPTKEGVDRIWAGSGVVYFSRLTSRATSSRMNRVASLPVYKQMTIRNWNTTTKLRELLDAETA